MADLSKASADSLSRYKQVWAFSTDEMNAADQQTIVDYARAGGNVVIFPYLPDREMSQKPCTVIRDALSISPSGKEIIDSPLIDIFEFKDIKCANPQIVYSEDSSAGRGNNCPDTEWYSMRIYQDHWDEGQSFTWEHGSDLILRDTNRSMKQFLKDQAPFSGRHLPPDEYLTVRERFTDDNRALLFVGNYYNEELRGKVTYTHPETGEAVSIPLFQR